MKPVKGRYATLLKALGALFTDPPHKALDYGELGALLGVSEEAVKTWARRGISAEGRLTILAAADERGATIAARVKDLLRGVKTPPGVAQDDAGAVERPLTPASQRSGQGVASGPVREVGAEYAGRERVRVLADRIARSVEQTVATNELGYTPKTRADVAASLEAFARELEARCGPGTAGDIWRVIVWLGKPKDGKA